MDALIAVPASFPKRDRSRDKLPGISMRSLGFTNVKHKDFPSRTISKIMDPNTFISESE